MIQLINQSLIPYHSNILSFLQRDIDLINNYASKVQEGKKAFKNKNKKGNVTFDHIKDVLYQMCSGAKRCCYCEDSAATQVEHIFPKDIFPDRVFFWHNYLYSCDYCNKLKSNYFSIINDSILINITPKRKSEPKPPPPFKTIAFINPRIENPLDLIWLDLKTFRYTEKLDEDEDRIAYLKANYTINKLQLNEREYLVDSRQTSYSNYKNAFTVYNLEKQKGASQSYLNKLISNLRSNNNPTVWEEMKRQHIYYAELKELFKKSPEALTW